MILITLRLGPTGTGTQMMSWIHIDDWLHVVAKCINDSTLSGPVNATAPAPVSNTTFATTLGVVLNRPAVIPLPGFVLKVGLGSQLVDELLLNGCSVYPSKLERSGFQFRYKNVESALAAVCNGSGGDVRND